MAECSLSRQNTRVDWGLCIPRNQTRADVPSQSCRKRDCLCQYCANTDLKLEGLRCFSNRHGLDLQITDKFSLSRMTLCPKGQTREYQRRCLERSCLDCGTSALELEVHLRPLTQTRADKTVSYLKWLTVSVGEKQRFTCRRQQVSAPAFVEELAMEAKTFSKHLFDAYWKIFTLFLFPRAHHFF